MSVDNVDTGWDALSTISSDSSFSVLKSHEKQDAK